MSSTFRRTALAVASIGMFVSMAYADGPVAPVNAAPAFKPGGLQATQAAFIGPEDCQDFAPNTLMAVPGAGWMVRSGAIVLVKGYATKADADHAKSIIQQYGFTQQCFVGRMQGQMMYWKASGKIPNNKLSGEDCYTFAAGGGYVNNSGGMWMAMAGLAPAGRYSNSDRAGAERAVQLIKAYKFTRMCQIVRPQGQMTYWLKD